MKICLRKGHHTVYDSLVKYPPHGIEYVIPPLTSKSRSLVNDRVKKSAFKAYLKLLNKPHSIYVKCKDTDLIHACSGIMINNKEPWVIDTEHVASFAGFEAGRLEKVKKQVEKTLTSDYCRKIMPWSEAAKQSIINGLDAGRFKDKIEVVYPAMEPIYIKKQKHSPINMLFISVRFYTKGGKEVLEAFDALGKKYDVNLTIISHVPETVKRKYHQVKFLEPNISREIILNEYFSKADIFVLPSYMDTFGMVYLEAMSAGIPIVSTNVFAIPEIVGGAGLLTDVKEFSWYGSNYLFAWKSWDKFSDYCENRNKPKVVGSLVKNISELIENSSLRKKMGTVGKREVTEGRFSIEHRNAKLKAIYKEALE